MASGRIVVNENNSTPTLRIPKSVGRAVVNEKQFNSDPENSVTSDTVGSIDLSARAAKNGGRRIFEMPGNAFEIYRGK